MMQVTGQQVTEWIETNLIPKLSRSIGKSSDNVRCNISFPENSFYASCVCFLDLAFESDEKNNRNEGENKLRLVIKRPPLDDELGKKMNMTIHFHNEILFYTKVARGNPIFPRCVFTAEDTPENTVIVTENVSPQGYDLCPEAYDIPLEYVFSAINEIARFHAMAYAMKEQEPEEFNKVVNDIREARFIPGGWLNEFFDIIASRPIPWLRRNNCDPKFCDKLERYFDNTFNKVMLSAVKPVEPLATLCHGDFTRNNVFFRRIDGKLEAMLIDFAVMGYSSPIIDISTFLYLHCSSTDRISKFSDIFKSYHDTLIDYLCEAGINDLEKYSYDNMLAEYKRVAAFGYVIAVDFLPVVRDPSCADPSSIMDHKAGAFLTRELGGEAMDELFGNMILELRDIGCFDHLC